MAVVPCIRGVPWFPAPRRQEQVCDRGSAVSGGSQHGDGQEELELTHRNDATTAPRRRLGNSPRVAPQSYLLVAEDDFAKATGVAKVFVEG